MIEININNIAKSYGFNYVLNKFSLEIKTGEIIALIGENGCGKSTLLNIINGYEAIDSGNVSIRKNSIIGYMTQNPIECDNNILVKEILYENIPNILEIENQLKKYEMQMNNCSNKELTKIIEKYTTLQEKYIDLGGYEIENKINKLASDFKIEKFISEQYNNLSTGEKRLVNLASVMIKNPNILLLDEPTNHLDINILEFLENYLKNYKGTILMVSHDRYFIDKIATKIVLIENGRAIPFNGNYSNYIVENQFRMEKEWKDYQDQSKIINLMKKKIKQLEEFGKLAYPGGEPFFKRAENIRKRLNRIELKEKPQIKKELPINLNIDTRSANKVIVINDYTLSINNNILIDNINVCINYNDKVCIMGNNGCGKSTLIKKILENNDLHIKIGSNVKIGYIPQEIIFKEKMTILEFARSFYIGEESHLRSALNKFGFKGEFVFKLVNNLSEGEKLRLKLFELIQLNNNCIILDEPTNNIDISTREVLEKALNIFLGTIIFISHDRYFINNLATKILYINNKQINEYIGNYDDNKKFFI